MKLFFLVICMSAATGIVVSNTTISEYNFLKKDPFAKGIVQFLSSKGLKKRNDFFALHMERKQQEEIINELEDEIIGMEGKKIVTNWPKIYDLYQKHIEIDKRLYQKYVGGLEKDKINFNSKDHAFLRLRIFTGNENDEEILERFPSYRLSLDIIYDYARIACAIKIFKKKLFISEFVDNNHLTTATFPALAYKDPFVSNLTEISQPKINKIKKRKAPLLVTSDNEDDVPVKRVLVEAKDGAVFTQNIALKMPSLVSKLSSTNYLKEIPKKK